MERELTHAEWKGREKFYETLSKLTGKDIYSTVSDFGDQVRENKLNPKNFGLYFRDPKNKDLLEETLGKKEYASLQYRLFNEILKESGHQEAIVEYETLPKKETLDEKLSRGGECNPYTNLENEEYVFEDWKEDVLEESEKIYEPIEESFAKMLNEIKNKPLSKKNSIFSRLYDATIGKAVESYNNKKNLEGKLIKNHEDFSKNEDLSVKAIRKYYSLTESLLSEEAIEEIGESHYFEESLSGGINEGDFERSMIGIVNLQEEKKRISTESKEIKKKLKDNFFYKLPGRAKKSLVGLAVAGVLALGLYSAHQNCNPEVIPKPIVQPTTSSTTSTTIPAKTPRTQRYIEIDLNDSENKKLARERGLIGIVEKYSGFDHRENPTEVASRIKGIQERNPSIKDAQKWTAPKDGKIQMPILNLAGVSKSDIVRIYDPVSGDSKKIDAGSYYDTLEKIDAGSYYDVMKGGLGETTPEEQFHYELGVDGKWETVPGNINEIPEDVVNKINEIPVEIDKISDDVQEFINEIPAVIEELGDSEPTSNLDSILQKRIEHLNPIFQNRFAKEGLSDKVKLDYAVNQNGTITVINKYDFGSNAVIELANALEHTVVDPSNYSSKTNTFTFG